MKNVYLIRTAAVASLVTAVIGLSSLGFQGEDVDLTPVLVAAEPVTDLPAAYELRPRSDEGEVFEYY